MRVRIIFFLKNRGAFVPFHHQFLLAQMIKGVLIFGGNESYFNWNQFNFSALKGQTKASRKGLHYFSSKVTLVLSSYNEDFINYFLTTLFTLPKVEVGDLILNPGKVEKESIDFVESSETFICLSPLVLTKPTFESEDAALFINPESDEYSDKLYDITMYMLESMGDYTSEQLNKFNKFQLVPDSEYLNKMEQKNKKYSRVYPVYDQDVKYEVRGYTFPFVLYAEPEVKRFVFINGIGELPHKGFGMIDMAHQDPNNRSEDYPISGY